MKSSGQNDTVEYTNQFPLVLRSLGGFFNLAWQTLKVHTKNLEEKILSRQIVWSSAVAMVLAGALFLNIILPNNRYLSPKGSMEFKESPKEQKRSLASKKENEGNPISIQPKLDKYFR